MQSLLVIGYEMIGTPQHIDLRIAIWYYYSYIPRHVSVKHFTVLILIMELICLRIKTVIVHKYMYILNSIMAVCAYVAS